MVRIENIPVDGGIAIANYLVRLPFILLRYRMLVHRRFHNYSIAF